MPSKADVIVRRVPIILLSNLWADVAPWLAQGAHAANEPERELLRKVLQSEAALWAIIDTDGKIIGAFLTKITDDGASLHMWALAGRNVWAFAKRVHAALIEEATRLGLHAVKFYGRAGWARFFPDCIVHIDQRKGGHALFERVLP